MLRSQLLASRLREVLLSGKWIANTNYKEQITDISLEQAVMKVKDLNSIALIVFHINYYLGGLINVLCGGTLDISDKYSFDMPEIRSAEDWNLLVNSFLNNAENFTNQVEKLDDQVLDLPFVDEKYGSYQRNIEGVIEHSYYHLGQVSLIKKLLS